MLHVPAGSRRWTAVGAGIEMSVLRANDTGGGSIVLRIAAGARFPIHDHPGGEEVFVVAGDVTLGGLRARVGDYVWTPPNETHDLVANEDSVLFVTSSEGIELLE